MLRLDGCPSSDAIGRALRPNDGQRDADVPRKRPNCLVLDYGQNVKRHGPVNKVKPRHTRANGAEKDAPPTKECPDCSTIVMLATRVCPFCKYEWPAAEITIEHDKLAAWEAPFDPEANKPRKLTVTAWFFRKHEKPDKPPSLRVDFVCGMLTISEWVCLEHEGFARQKATRWWSTFKGGGPITVERSTKLSSEPKSSGDQPGSWS